MRLLTILCGLAILINGFHMAHFIHQFAAHQSDHFATFWAEVAFAALIDLLSLIGGVLLLRRSATA